MFQGYLRQTRGMVALAEETDTSIASLRGAFAGKNLLVGEARVIVLGRTHD